LPTRLVRTSRITSRRHLLQNPLSTPLVPMMRKQEQSCSCMSATPLGMLGRCPWFQPVGVSGCNLSVSPTISKPPFRPTLAMILDAQAPHPDRPPRALQHGHGRLFEQWRAVVRYAGSALTEGLVTCLLRRSLHRVGHEQRHAWSNRRLASAPLACPMPDGSLWTRPQTTFDLLSARARLSVPTVLLIRCSCVWRSNCALRGTAWICHEEAVQDSPLPCPIQDGRLHGRTRVPPSMSD